MNTNLVCLGVITSPHGVRGAVRIRTFTEKPENISLYGGLISNNESYEINLVNVIANHLVIATIGGINSFKDAKLLRNKKLYIKRSKLPKLRNESEFYQSDLINMEVRLENNELYGYIVSIYNFGSGDILEISVIKTRKNIMLSFTKDIFPHINLKRGYVVLAMPEFID
ncbi:MAG: ribosome maturation factor RimM [Wolbachia endosymbiont of Meromenopon meropis]|nr:ribosome maturation factor RimM [Wolbachia endosymbiont of Meromenopon meropis]